MLRELEEHRRGGIKSRCTSNQDIIWDKTTLVAGNKQTTSYKSGGHLNIITYTTIIYVYGEFFMSESLNCALLKKNLSFI